MAKEEKTVLGHIDCPHCGERMRVIHDKNKDPFGHCEDCSGQLRVGGRPGRVRAFVRRYPWAAASAAPVTVTEAVPATVPVAGKALDQPTPPKKKASFADALNFLGGSMQLENHDAPDEVLSGEAATDLRALAAMADADPNVLPDPDAPVEPIRPPLSEEIAGMLLMLANMAAPMFPSLKLIYTPEACQAVGASVQPVCEKYGWMQDGIGGEYGPEIMCVCVVGPMAFATYTAVKNDNAARQAKAEQKPEGQPAKAGPPPGALRAPGSDTVTFGAPVHENQ